MPRRLAVIICLEINRINVGWSFISFCSVAERPLQVQGMGLFLKFGKHHVSAICCFHEFMNQNISGTNKNVCDKVSVCSLEKRSVFLLAHSVM